MNRQLHEDHVLEAAWQELEFEFRTVGMAEPESGFVNRWKDNLAKKREEEQRRQAWIFVGINVVTAFILLIMIGVLRIPFSEGVSGMFVGIVGVFTKFFVWLKVMVEVLESLVRTLPGLLPISWWLSVAVSLGILYMLWFSVIKRILLQQGVEK